MQRHVNDARALAFLLNLSEWNVAVGREVVAALVALGPRAVPDLADVLADPVHSRVARMAAAWLLGHLGDSRAVNALIRAQGDADAQVASAASEALARREGQPDPEALSAA